VSGDAAVLLKENESKNAEISKLNNQLKKTNGELQARNSEVDQLNRKLQAAESENKKLKTGGKSGKAAKPANLTVNSTPVRRSVQPSGTATPRSQYATQTSAAPLGKTQARSLTLKQLKDMIADMYNQKVKFDKKCEDNRLPRETMEQFMYTFLN